jgi:hypothetical protein
LVDGGTDGNKLRFLQNSFDLRHKDRVRSAKVITKKVNDATIPFVQTLFKTLSLYDDADIMII